MTLILLLFDVLTPWSYSTLRRAKRGLRLRETASLVDRTLPERA